MNMGLDVVHLWYRGEITHFIIAYCRALDLVDS